MESVPGVRITGLLTMFHPALYGTQTSIESTEGTRLVIGSRCSCWVVAGCATVRVERQDTRNVRRDFIVSSPDVIRDI